MPKQPSSALVTIDRAHPPALHQSTQLLTACPCFYVETVIKGRRKPGGMEAARGNQVHRVMAQYASWCAQKQIPMDLDAFDNFAKGVGPSAAKILAGMRESYAVDWEHLLATEVPMSLDEHFQPTEVRGSLEGVSVDSGLKPHYQGTLDAIYMFRNDNRILIDDAKTHARPFDPSDPEKALQGQMYSLFIFQHFPWVNEVKFRLVFVRFKNLTREVIYTRADLPSLIESVKAARERQKMIHFNFDSGIQMEATPGDHCFFCPLLSDRSCPIGQLNENMQSTPEEWARWDIWNTQFSKVNKKRMKDYVNASGRSIVIRDYNGKAYSYGPSESESEVYPLFQATASSVATKCWNCYQVLDHIPENGKCPQCKKAMVRAIMPIVDKLEEYGHGTPGDTQWFGKLSVSSTELNSKLNTKKRAFLDQSIQDSADHVTKVKMKMSKPLDMVTDAGPEDESEESWEDESEF